MSLTPRAQVRRHNINIQATNVIIPTSVIAMSPIILATPRSVDVTSIAGPTSSSDISSTVSSVDMKSVSRVVDRLLFISDCNVPANVNSIANKIRTFNHKMFLNRNLAYFWKNDAHNHMWLNINDKKALYWLEGTILDCEYIIVVTMSGSIQRVNRIVDIISSLNKSEYYIINYHQLRSLQTLTEKDFISQLKRVVCLQLPPSHRFCCFLQSP